MSALNCTRIFLSDVNLKGNGSNYQSLIQGNNVKRRVLTYIFFSYFTFHPTCGLFYQHGLTLIPARITNHMFLHDRPWKSPWMKSISNELDITCHVLSSQLSGYCDAIANQLWRHQQNVKRASETRGWCVEILVFSAIHLWIRYVV